MSGKTAIVTGCVSGYRVLRLHIDFVKPVPTSLSAHVTADAVGEVAHTLKDKGHTVHAMAADISQKADVESLIEETTAQFSQIDILVNNAGITRDMLLMRLKDEDWHAVLQTNLTGTMYCTRAVLRPMIRQKSGRIINISSVVGLAGNAGQVNYAAAKAGIIGLTKATAKEVGARGITVNAVAPGFITTDMTAQISEQHQKQLLEMIPLREFGASRRCSRCCLFSGIGRCTLYHRSNTSGRWWYGDVIHRLSVLGSRFSVLGNSAVFWLTADG